MGAGQNLKRDERVDGHRKDADAAALEESKIMMMLIGGCGQVLRRRRILKEGVV